MARIKLPETILGRRLAEALSELPTFRQWLLHKLMADLPGWATCSLHLMYVRDDWPEKTLDNRRTDIWVAFSDTPDRPTCTHLLLGELKILAPFSSGQAEDYRHRAEKACGRFCRTAATVLLAPQRYLASVGSDGEFFHVKISLEEIKAFFDDPAECLDEATVNQYVLYRTIIGKALKDAAAGYVGLGNEIREEQFRWYKLFVADYKSHLVVHDRKGNDQSYDIQLDLPIKGFGYIKHRLIKGRVVIEWLSKGHLLAKVQGLVDKISKGRLIVEYTPQGRPGVSLHIRFRDANVRSLAMGHSFADQTKIVQAGIDAADELWQWVFDHRPEIEDFLRTVN